MSRFRRLAIFLPFAVLCAIPLRGEGIKLLISVRQQDIAFPGPVHATLHFHNAGQQTVWLYRPVRRRQAADQSNSTPIEARGQGSGQSYGGSTLEVHFVEVNSAVNGSNRAAGHGFVLEPDALPRPGLVRLAPGNDYDEKVNIHVVPAETKAGGGSQPVWGRYSFSVTYSASYSNAGILARDINATLWTGQVNSNVVTLNVQPSTAQGSITGTVLDSIGRPFNEALVTLSDVNENGLNQLYSDMDGRFSFTRLPMGRYWITVREPGSNHDTSVFRLIQLNQGDSTAKVQVMILPVQSDKADSLLHKPVIFHIVDNKGHPLGKVKLAILLTTGNVIENVKSETKDDGFTAVSLIPGLNLVTLQLPGCKGEQRQADVAYGPGVDGFKYAYTCSRK